MRTIDLKTPLILACDVDTADEALAMTKKLGRYLGAVKIGPRLQVRYGADLVERLSEITPVFVDNKYLDIPNTMEAAVRASFESGATLATVHAWSGPEAMARLAKLEEELNKKRPFKILAVTVLTSFNDRTLPPGLIAQPIATHVKSLGFSALDCGLSGIVCSAQELSFFASVRSRTFLVTPGVRLATDSAADQKRVETPENAIRQGATALVIGRPIYEAKDPVAATEAVMASIKQGQSA